MNSLTEFIKINTVNGASHLFVLKVENFLNSSTLDRNFLMRNVKSLKRSMKIIEKNLKRRKKSEFASKSFCNLV